MNAAYVETIRNKIINNIGELTEEELSFIGVVPDLALLLIQEVVKQKEAKIAEKTINTIGEKLIDIVPADIREEFWTMALGYGSAASLSIDAEEFASYIDMLGLEQSSVEKYKEQVFKILQDPNLELSNYTRLTDGGVRFLLDQKRYDLFDQVNQIPEETLTDSTYNRFLNEYPDKNKSFLFLIDYKYKNSLYNEISIEELVNYYGYIDSYKKNGCLFLIMSKINKVDDLSNLSLDIDWSLLTNDLHGSKGYEQYLKIIEEIYKKGCFLDLDSLEENPNISIEQIKSDLLRIINSQEASREYLKSIMKKRYHRFGFTETDSYKKDREIFKALADNDYLDVVFDCYHPNIILKNIDIVKDAIIRKTSKTFTADIDQYLSSLPIQVLEIIIENVDSFKIDALFLPPEESKEELIFNILDKNIPIDSIHFSNNHDLSDRLSLKLLEKGYYKQSINNSYIITSTKFRKYIIEYIQKDSSFALELPDRYLRFVLENDDILDIYLNAIDPVIDLLINKLNHDEELVDLYNKHIFEKLKPYFCKKYNYDPDKLELVENHFGPTIIRFIDNENIASILNLPKEDIEKLIKLFPKTEFTMDELKASYESLVQYSFAKNKQKEHGLFATLMHAIQDEDKRVINECKIALMNTIDIDTFEKLRQKYNIQQTTLAEYFDYTVEQIINGINKKDNIDSIHNVVNEYVSIERKKYHNNHFFDRVYSDYGNLYEEIVKAIDEKDQDYLTWVVVCVMKDFFTDDFYKKFSVHHEMNENLKNPEVLMGTIFEKIAIPEKREKYLTILKFITDYVHDQKKKSKSKYLDFGQELRLPYYLDQKSLDRALEREITLIRPQSYYVIVDGIVQYVIDLIAEKLIPEGISKEIIKDIIFDINHPEQDILRNRITHDYNYLNGQFNRIILELHKRGEIPFYDWSEAHQKLKSTKLKTQDITLYDYIKKQIPAFDDYLLYIENPTKGEEAFKNKYRQLIPKIIKAGKEVIKGKEVFEQYGYSVEESVYRSYIEDRKHIFFRIKGKDIPMFKILYEVLKNKVEWDSNSLFKYLTSDDPYAINPSPNDFKLIIQAVKELVAQFPVIYDNKEEKTYDRDVVKKIVNKRDANRVYVPDKTEMGPYEILANLNIELLTQTVLHDEKMYSLLLKIMETKKIHLYPDSINRLLKDLDIDMSLDASNIAAFISYFPSILEEEKKRYLRAGKEVPDEIPFTAATILAEAEVFGTASSVFAQILGKEDAKLIKANPKENQATLKLANNGRLKEAVSLTLECFKRKEVTVPPFAQEFTTKGGQKLKAICGNFTNPCNLTHGERTSACMRIGGAGETLFYFALRNKNGFHIRFENPETGEYVSRVTGFRNGNTVFLNELRCSVSNKYSNDDVVDICEQVAQALIEMSKDSPCPIENVVIHGRYAMDYSSRKPTKINVKNVKEGLCAFYSDVDDMPIVLATTAEDADFTPVNLDKSRVPTYPTLRGEIKAITNEAKMVAIMNRVLSINDLLAGKSYEDLSAYTIEDGFLYGIASEDWFIYVNEHLEIKYGIIDIDPRAQQELSETLLKVETMIKERRITNEESDSYGL